MLERFKTMSAEEQQQFLARMKERGGDSSPFEALMTAKPAAGSRQVQGAQAQTIDALFAPLPAVESRGRPAVGSTIRLAVSRWASES